MVDLETIIALAFMTTIVDLHAYELHLGMKTSPTTSLMNAKDLHSTDDRVYQHGNDNEDAL